MDDFSCNYIEALNISTTKCLGIVTSANDHVGVLVAKGVEMLIFEASAKACQVYRRELVSPINTIPLEKWLRRSDNQVFWNSSLHEINEFVFLFDAISFVPKIIPASVITCFQFSPSFHNNCYLAAITSHGAGHVYQRIGGTWMPVCDFVEVWLEKCTASWEMASTYVEWKRQLYAGKPKSICWILDSGTLYLFICLLNSNVVVMKKTSMNKFSLEFVTHLEFEVEEPMAVHAFKINDCINIIITNYYGQIYSFRLQDWKVVKSDTLFPERDHYECLGIIQLGNQLVVNKTQFILSLNFDANNSVSISEKLMCQVLNTFFAEDYLHVALADGTIVKLNVHDLTEVARSKIVTSGYASHAAASPNGLLNIFVNNSSNNTTIQVYFNSSLDVLKLSGKLLQSKSTWDCLDLLWIIKWKTLNNGDNEVGEAWLKDYPKLRYWLLCFLSCLSFSRKEDMSPTLQTELNKLQLELVREHVLENIHLNESFNFILGITDKKDYCILCQSIVRENRVNLVVCSNDHALPKCCFTLKPCLAPNYMTCQLCTAVRSG